MSDDMGVELALYSRTLAATADEVAERETAQIQAESVDDSFDSITMEYAVDATRAEDS